jgi:flagellar hook-associated protein 2
MSTLRIGGMGSGMDIAGIIQKVLDIDTNRIKTVQESQTGRNERIGAWLEVKTKLSDFTQAADTLRWMDVWRKMAPVSTNPETATATAASNAAHATYTIDVTQLARAQTIGSTAGLTTGGASPEAVTASTNLVDIDGINVGDQFAIAGQTFTIAADDTLSTLRTKINEAAASMPDEQRVSANILDNRLVLQRTETGTDPIVVSDLTGSPLQTIGVLDSFGVPANELLPAQNAVFTVNGAVIERSSNTELTDVLDGVTLNLTGIGSTQLTIANDTQAVKDAITTFVDTYNAYAETIEFHGEFDQTDPTNPVPGVLQGDFMVREMISKIRGVATSASPELAGNTYEYNGQEGIMNALYSVGIWTTGQDNRLEIVDSARLDAMLAENPVEVENLFRGVQDESGVRTGGIALNLYNTGRNYSNDLDGWIDVRIENIDEEIKQTDERIDTMIKAMEMKENLLWKQFNAMDEAIGQMNSDLEYLKNNLGMKE